MENKYDIYRGEDCMNCEYLTEHAKKLINCNKRKTLSKICYISKKKKKTNILKINIKLGSIVIVHVNIEVLHIAYVT